MSWIEPGKRRRRRGGGLRECASAGRNSRWRSSSREKKELKSRPHRCLTPNRKAEGYKYNSQSSLRERDKKEGPGKKIRKRGKNSLLDGRDRRLPKGLLVGPPRSNIRDLGKNALVAKEKEDHPFANR